MDTNKEEFWDRKWEDNRDSIDLLVSRIRRQQMEHPILQYISKRYQDMTGIEVCEVGAGLARTSLSLGIRGAKVTLMDISPVALEKSKKVARALGVQSDCVEMDVLAPSRDMLGRFDVVIPVLDYFGYSLSWMCIKKRNSLL